MKLFASILPIFLTLLTVTSATAIAEPEHNPSLESRQLHPGANYCSTYVYVRPGWTCERIAESARITVQKLKELNRFINSGCTNVQANYWLCAGRSGLTRPPPEGPPRRRSLRW
ncbi:hypothetical protein BJ508DRAFT_363176 [Ascobolus immersus RN42]|uniref:LysM domain-containing protein n=1 Tax=Ascobolus immersus RN42 TaxID=1160509 RepID=A0A3N4I000_ASCIM|nr:hypothetical protein BJ508DRAFT_363176 [Ascobolus immersus RN42]